MGTAGFFKIRSQKAGVREKRKDGRKGEEPLVRVLGWLPLWATKAHSCWGPLGELHLRIVSPKNGRLGIYPGATSPLRAGVPGVLTSPPPPHSPTLHCPQGLGKCTVQRKL